MNRVVDRGAITAAWVGVGMAVTIVASFTLIIPIEWLIWLLALPSGLIIGYYANQRSGRGAGPWRRILSNGLFAGVATGLTVAFLLLLVKSIFFFADSGYPDFNRVDEAGQPIPPTCAPGAGCVYERYLLAGRGPDLAEVGATDVASFERLYWSEQLGSSWTVLLLTGLGGLGGAAAYRVNRPRGSSATAEAPAG